MKYPKSFYQVYECVDVTNCFSYDESKVMYETDNLSEAHGFAYGKWVQDESKAYTIIQPCDDSCRGGYGEWAK